MFLVFFWGQEECVGGNVQFSHLVCNQAIDEADIMFNGKFCKKERIGRGYSFVEVLIGLFLFSVVILLILGLYLQSFASSEYSSHVVTATDIASEKIAQMKAENYSDLSSKADSSYESTETQEVEGITYTVTTRVNRLSSNPADREHDVLRIQVKVVWQDSVSTEFSKNKVKTSISSHEIEMEGMVTPVSAY